MYTETERKFLVDHVAVGKELPTEHDKIIQGYIFNTNGGLLRVRITNLNAFLTIKSNNTGGTCLEYEYEIPVSDATHMIEHMCSQVLRKVRYKIPYAGHIWEVDFFNSGKVLAEVELTRIDEIVMIPSWALKEVTGDPQYYNCNMLEELEELEEFEGS